MILLKQVQKQHPTVNISGFRNGTRDLGFEPSHGASELAHYPTNLHRRKTLIHTLHCV